MTQVLFILYTGAKSVSKNMPDQRRILMPELNVQKTYSRILPLLWTLIFIVEDVNHLNRLAIIMDRFPMIFQGDKYNK